MEYCFNGENKGSQMGQPQKNILKKTKLIKNLKTFRNSFLDVCHPRSAGGETDESKFVRFGTTPRRDHIRKTGNDKNLLLTFKLNKY